MFHTYFPHEKTQKIQEVGVAASRGNLYLAPWSHPKAMIEVDHRTGKSLRPDEKVAGG